MRASGSGRKPANRMERGRAEAQAYGASERRVIMCPACVASTAVMISSVLSTGGLTALVVAILARRERRKEQL
jgi:hypothetical protein